MLTNLLSNALKFTPRGGERAGDVRRAADRIDLTVEDTGRGIATEYLPHIFDRFYRVPVKGTAPGPDQGLGLGLSFVAWIVRAHNGKIDVASTPGEGTRFKITIPASLEQIPEPVAADVGGSAAGSRNRQIESGLGSALLRPVRRSRSRRS